MLAAFANRKCATSLLPVKQERKKPTRQLGYSESVPRGQSELWPRTSRLLPRFPKDDTHRLDFDENWLEDDDDWQLKVYEVDPIPEGSTVVDLQKLRAPITDEAQTQLKDHFSSTYAKFITNKNVVIKLDGETLTPEFFENWAYPPGYPPTRYTGALTVEDGKAISVEALAGLTLESSPATGEYGVYFYCNNRLVSRAMKTFEVGFTRGLAGVAHPKVSLTRAPGNPVNNIPSPFTRVDSGVEGVRKPEQI